MPFPALLLVLAVLMPLVAFLTLLPLGKRLGTPLAGYVATFFIAASFICSGWGMLRWLTGGNYHGQPYGKLLDPINLAWRLPFTHGGGWVASIYIDSLTFALFVTINLVALLIHVFAGRSLRRDLRFARFFVFLSLSCFATLAVFLSGNIVQLIIFLEILAIAISLLVGFRADGSAAVRSCWKMFIVGRIGDIGLLVGVLLIVRSIGNASLPELWLHLGGQGGAGETWTTLIGIALFCGVAGRCAQFPLQVWAGDIADGVAPALAMVYVAGLATSGIYLLARIFPILTPSARLMVAIVGVTTLLMAALIATVQPDLKKALGWLAASQLGYMVLAMGIGSWSGAIFHLIAYSFFQLLLILAAGAVVRATRGETHLSQFGGLLFKMPVTAIASLVALLAMCGAGWGSIGLSGYFSHELILQHAAAYVTLAAEAHRSWAYAAFFYIPALTNFITAFAIARWWILIFAGEPRDMRLYDHAREATTLFWPLVIVAIMSMLAGNWLGVADMVDSATRESIQQVDLIGESHGVAAPSIPALDSSWPAEGSPDEEGSSEDMTGTQQRTADALSHGQEMARRWHWPPMVLGLLLGMGIYLPRRQLSAWLVRVPPVSWVYAWLSSQMYFDDLYDALFVQPVLGIAWLVGLRRRIVPIEEPPQRRVPLQNPSIVAKGQRD